MRHAPEILNLFGRQYWVASTDQLERVGLSRRAIERAVADGSIEPIARRIWHLTAAPFSLFSKRMTLQLIAGPDSYLGHGTAGEIMGLRRMPVEKPCIVVPGHRRIVVPSWGKVRYTNWPDPYPDMQIDGLIISSPLRTALDLGARLGDWAFESAAEQMWHMGLLTPEVCNTFVQAVRRSGRRGVTRNLTWLEGALTRDRPAQSGLEVDLARSLVNHGLPAPRRQIPLLLPTLGPVKVDLGWDDVRLGLEPGHSDLHEIPDGVRYDTVRDDEAGALGWVIRRYNERQLANMDRCVREIASIYWQRRQAIRSGLL